MTALLKSELRKLLTVQSTYVTTTLTLLFVGFISFYVEGVKAGAEIGPNKLSGVVTGSASLMAQVAAIMAIIFMINEYRYNLIYYTLTFNASRSKILAAKVIVVAVYALVLMVTGGILGMVLTALGVKAAGLTLPAQDINFLEVFGRGLFYTFGYSLAALIFATLFRSIVAAIGVLFVVSGTVEALLSILLKENVVYLPFTALREGLEGGDPIKGIVIFTAYVAVGWVVTWWLFLRRDAT